MKPDYSEKAVEIYDFILRAGRSDGTKLIRLELEVAFSKGEVCNLQATKALIDSIALGGH